MSNKQHKGKKKTKQKSGNPASRVWTKFEQVEPAWNQKVYDNDKEAYLEHLEAFKRGSTRMFQNSLYTVTVHFLREDFNPEGAMQIAIRTNDRKPAKDWRHFQRIKNIFAGYEREAYEIYPPESQLMDEANQYHLWVLPIGVGLPFAYRVGRTVLTEEEAKKSGGGQRDMEPGDIPDQDVWDKEIEANKKLVAEIQAHEKDVSV